MGVVLARNHPYGWATRIQERMAGRTQPERPIRAVWTLPRPLEIKCAIDRDDAEAPAARARDRPPLVVRHDPSRELVSARASVAIRPMMLSASTCHRIASCASRSLAT